MRLDSLLSSAAQLLSSADISTAELDAEILLSAILGQDRSFFFAHPEYLLTKKEITQYARTIAQRTRRIPVAYILGKKDFFGLSLRVSPAVLIPRPETELIVDTALEYIKNNPAITSVVDVGTGSGCIPIAIARYASRQLSITAYDTSATSLRLARKNAEKHHVSIVFKNSDLLQKHRDSIDLLCANLPYLSLDEYRESIKQYPEMKYEPRGALVASKHGLALNMQLMKQLSEKMSRGAILLEMGATQGMELKKIARSYFPKAKVEIIKDLARRPRILQINLN